MSGCYNISFTLLTQLRERLPQVTFPMVCHLLSLHFLVHIYKNKFKWLHDIQILWNSSCLDALLHSMHSVRTLYQKVVREWIVVSLSPVRIFLRFITFFTGRHLCSLCFLLNFSSILPNGDSVLLVPSLCSGKPLQSLRTQPAADVVSLLSEIRIGTGKNDCWNGPKTANIPAVWRFLVLVWSVRQQSVTMHEKLVE